MSTHIDTAERARYVRQAAAQCDGLPSGKDAQETTGRGSFYFRPREGERWSDILRSAGLPGYDDLVAREIRQRWESRYPWQEFVTFTPGDVASETPLRGAHVGRLVRRLADGRRSHDALDGLALSIVSESNVVVRWEVREA